MSFNAFLLATSVWLPWLLFGLLLIGVLIAVIVYLRNRPKGISEIKAKLKESEAATREYQASLAEAKVRLKEAEKAKAASDLALLEAKHVDKIKALTAKEKETYAVVKDDPEAGVDHMRKLLGLDS